MGYNINLGSTFGLGRALSRYIGLALIIFGVVLATPPGTTPDDFINAFLAANVALVLGIGFLEAFVLTYTLIPLGLILLGASFYPYNTGILLRSIKNRIVRALYVFLTNPIYLAVGIFMFYIIWIWGSGYFMYLEEIGRLII